MELGLRFRFLAHVPQQVAKVVVAARQTALKIGEGGVVVGQLLLDRQRPAELGGGFGSLAGRLQETGDSADRIRQVALRLSRRSGCVGQHLLVGPPSGRLTGPLRCGRCWRAASRDATDSSPGQPRGAASLMVVTSSTSSDSALR